MYGGCFEILAYPEAAVYCFDLFKDFHGTLTSSASGSMSQNEWLIEGNGSEFVRTEPALPLFGVLTLNLLGTIKLFHGVFNETIVRLGHTSHCGQSHGPWIH